MQTYHQMPLEDLCALVLATCRSFVKEFPMNDIAADAIERGTLRRTLETLAARAGLVERENSDIDLLSAVLERELERETLGSFQVFDGRNDPEVGAVGDVREVRDLTDRGDRIEEQLRTLRLLGHMRDVCRARLDARQLMLGR